MSPKRRRARPASPPAGWDTSFAPQVPATHPRIALVLRLLVTPHELERPHSILVVLLAADGQELARVEAQVNPLPAEQRQLIPAGRSVGIGAVLNFVNVVFPAYGDYGIKIHWDGGARPSAARQPASTRRGDAGHDRLKSCCV
jgi:hypothetical protein